jgi:hypothetical protein
VEVMQRILLIVTVVLAAIGGYLFYQHKAPKVHPSSATLKQFDSVATGQSRDTVEALLGPATGGIRRDLISGAFKSSSCTRLNPAYALYYYRAPNSSFVIYLNENNVVICKEERHMAIHIN